MPITFNCACGKSLRVADENAGRRVKCPACDAVTTVPRPEPEFEVVEDVSEPIASPPPPAPKARPVAKPSTRDDDDDDRRGYGVAKRDRDDEEEEEEKPRSKKKPKWKNRPPEQERGSGGGGGTSASAEIGGGLVSMLIGAVLFGIAFMNDRFSILGIVLFIAGVIGVIKGLAGGSGE